jgi:hypothetical protein
MEDDDVDIEYNVQISPWTYQNDTIWPSGGYTISLGPLESRSPPDQPDMFRHYIASQWIHSSHLADENPQWQVEAWVESKPYLREAKAEGKLEITNGKGDDDFDYYFVGTDEEFLIFKMRWSEYL